MELNITELEDIPENNFDTGKRVKTVRFTNEVSVSNEVTVSNEASIEPSIGISKKSVDVKSPISYEDILSKMGMFVHDGKLHLKENNSIIKKQVTEQANLPSFTVSPDQNSYIYNKYFKSMINPVEPEVRKPKTLAEYKHMLVMDRLKQERIRQIKSRKMVIGVNTYGQMRPQSDMNVLFNFSRK